MEFDILNTVYPEINGGYSERGIIMETAIHRIAQLSEQGYACGQILMIMGLEARGSKDLSKVHNMSGLTIGCGAGTGACGLLTGGCGLLTIFGGKVDSKWKWNSQLPQMIQDLTDWFWESYGYRYGGIDCNSIRNTETIIFEPTLHSCGKIVMDVYLKVLAILRANNFDFAPNYCFQEYHAN
jgi:hypothetical protein